MTDIVDRVRDIAIYADLTQVQQDCLDEAADTIEKLRKLEGLVESQRSLIAAYYADVLDRVQRYPELADYIMRTDHEPAREA